MGHVGTCGPKCYGFSVVLVVNRISILADFGHSRVCSLYSSLDLGIVLRSAHTMRLVAGTVARTSRNV